jgi:DNA-binding response OmpR family regulator
MDQVTSLPQDPPIPSALVGTAGVCPRRGAILVVEDRDDVRQGLAQLLELHGFLVFDAADGEQALAHLKADPETIALVLLDLILPGTLSGRDVRAQQLADPRLSGVPTVIVSACEPDLRGRAQLQAEAWLEKPFRFDALLEIVKRYVVPEPGGIVNVES